MMQEAQRLGCGFSGPVWTSDTAGHMRWCLAAEPSSVGREQRERANALERCQFCASYADTAVDQQRQNRNFQCGLVGPQWHEPLADALWEKEKNAMSGVVRSPTSGDLIKTKAWLANAKARELGWIV
jgi:hypothetical protein